MSSFWKTTFPGVFAMFSPKRKAPRSLIFRLSRPPRFEVLNQVPETLEKIFATRLSVALSTVVGRDKVAG
jgi:hypothetical protein